jgi:hypothetical protein
MSCQTVIAHHPDAQGRVAQNPSANIEVGVPVGDVRSADAAN